MPWAGKNGLAKAVAFFATVLVVSVGLCGANYAVWIGVNSSAWHPGNSQALVGYGVILMGVVELVGMIVGWLGLVVVGLVAGVRAIVGSKGGSPGG